MSEEQDLILRMVADGKITPDEGVELLEALEESRRARSEGADSATAASDRGRAEAGKGGATRLSRLADSIGEAVDSGLRNLEELLAKRRSQMPDQQNRLQENLRRSTERALRAASEAEERAKQAAGWAQKKAAHAAKRLQQWAARPSDEGEQIKQVAVKRVEQLSAPAQRGDCLILKNRVGDVRIRFADREQVEVAVTKTAWGRERSEAEQREAATRVALVRQGSDLSLEVTYPESGDGLPTLRETQLDFTISLPHGTDLRVTNKVGDVTVVAGEQVGTWDLVSKVGNIDLQVAPSAGFRYEMRTSIGDLLVEMETGDESGEGQTGSGSAQGQVGDGAGQIHVESKTGDIRLHH